YHRKPCDLVFASMVTVHGIEFAPLFIPLRRRLQTLGVLYYGLEFLPLSFAYCLLLIYLLFTKFYFISITYFLWYCYDLKSCRKGGTRGRWLRKAIWWKWIRDYFPISLVKTCDLDPNKNYIFGLHPHGIMCFAVMCNFGSEANNISNLFPGMTTYVLTLEEIYKLPLHREIGLALGGRSVVKECLENLLTKNGVGNIVGVVVGGAVEALHAFPKKMILCLKDRKGFVKMALKTGTSLVPVLSFGENDIFNQVQFDENSWYGKLQRKITAVLRFSPPLFYGRGIFQYSLGLMPFRKPIVTIVGAPINVPLNLTPTDEEIERVHEQYTNCLKQLFFDNKDKYGFSDTELVIL
ncbi:2-acylglycerol O-acyltransferase 2-like protein, partial [Leptotrombidium deliense]